MLIGPSPERVVAPMTLKEFGLSRFTTMFRLFFLIIVFPVSFISFISGFCYLLGSRSFSIEWFLWTIVSFALLALCMYVCDE